MQLYTESPKLANNVFYRLLRAYWICVRECEAGQIKSWNRDINAFKQHVAPLKGTNVSNAAKFS